MNRPVISPSLRVTSSPIHTLEVMQRRIQMAEDETKKLVDQLAECGFSKEKHDQLVHEQTGNASGRIDPITPFTPTAMSSSQVEILQRNYEQMVARVCRAESTIQSLKLATCSLQAERNLGSLEKDPNQAAIPKDVYDRELKKITRDLSRARKELHEVKEGRKKAEDNAKKLSLALEKASSAKSSASVELEELKTSKQKLMKKHNELKGELNREKEMRSSVEESHSSLLQRVSDMEGIVNTERESVQTLAKECRMRKREAIMAKEEYEKEHHLRLQLETVLGQLQMDTENTDAQLITLQTERKNLLPELSRVKHENQELRLQFEEVRKSHEELKATHTNLLAEHRNTCELLRAANADNKVLVSQHRSAIERERATLNSRLVEKDGALEAAKQNILKELEKEREQMQAIDKERSSLKDEISRLNNQLQEERARTGSSREQLQTQIVRLEETVQTLTKERDSISKEKSQILEEISQTVSGFSQERDRIVTQLKNAQVDVEGLKQNKNFLEQENTKLLEKISSFQQRQVAQNQIDEAMKEMVESKSRLAYERGSLQSQVQHLQHELSSMTSLKNSKYISVIPTKILPEASDWEIEFSGIPLESFYVIEVELDHERRAKESIQFQHDKVSRELQSCRTEVNSLEHKLRESQGMSGRKDSDLRSVMKSREDALREVEKLLNHSESVEKKYIAKIETLQKAHNDARDSSRKLTSTVETLMTSHGELQMVVEGLQTKLGMKDSELGALRREKSSWQDAMEQLQCEVEDLQKKLRLVENSGKNELRPLRKSLVAAEDGRTKVSEQLENALRENKELQSLADRLQLELRRRQEEFDELQEERVHKLENVGAQLQKKELQEIKSRYKKEIAKLKRDLEDSQSLRTKLKERNSRLEERVGELEKQAEKTKSKTKSLKSQLDRARKSQKSKEQEEGEAKERIEVFKNELNELERVKKEYMAKNSEQARTISDFVSKISELQAELQNLVQAQMEATELCREKEKELERERDIRRELEKRHKVTEDLREAHEMFQKKFESLQSELMRSRKVQSALERQNRDQQNLIEQEKRKVEDATEKAKGILRASRLTINKLAGDVAENHWETKGMKHALQAERDYNAMSTRKLQRLQEASARQVEDLAFELDTLKRSLR